MAFSPTGLRLGFFTRPRSIVMLRSLNNLSLDKHLKAGALSVLIIMPGPSAGRISSKFEIIASQIAHAVSFTIIDIKVNELTTSRAMKNSCQLRLQISAANSRPVTFGKPSVDCGPIVLGNVCKETHWWQFLLVVAMAWSKFKAKKNRSVTVLS